MQLGCRKQVLCLHRRFRHRRSSITFETSMNGDISMIPAWYTVCVPNLPVGTRFSVVERNNEIPLGYKLLGYEREGGTYIVDSGTDENTGWVRANESPRMYVSNQRGWELEVRKIWSDESYVKSHAPIYTAVYISGDIIFTISELGTVTMTGAGEEGMLTVSGSQEENAYVINVPNNPVYSPANLTLTKTVNGTIGNKDKEFTFTIKAEGADSPEQYEWTKNGVSQTAALHSNGTFTMKHGDTVVITLPKRVSITITEDNEDYTTSFKLNQEDPEYVNSKTFVLQDNATIAVVNTRNALLPTGVRLSATWCVVIMLTALAGVVFLVMWRRRAD